MHRANGYSGAKFTLAPFRMTKTYDRAYFDRWYRNGEIGGAARLARKVALAVATALFVCTTARTTTAQRSDSTAHLRGGPSTEA